MIKIESSRDFYSMKKSKIINYLYSKGFGCLASSKVLKADLIYRALYIYKKYGA